MIIKANNIESTNLTGIIDELEKDSELIDYLLSHNLPVADEIEKIATCIYYDNNDYIFEN